MALVPGQLVVVGLGPGARDLLTPQAAAALRQAEIVIGYSGYFGWIEDLVHGKERIALPLGEEVERARAALEQAGAGRRVAVISSGDPGIYAMASLVFEMWATLPPKRRPEIMVVPGVSALNAAAALLGAPLGHDFAVISLSDLLTPWPTIEKRITAVAAADFVLALFNPRSQRRDWQLDRARTLILAERSPATPVGIVGNAFRPGQTVEVTTLGDMDTAKVDMFAIVMVGNTASSFVGNFIVTPRGYLTPAGE
jgi:precorrin-3B C17-methyltransferase